MTTDTTTSIAPRRAAAGRVRGPEGLTPADPQPGARTAATRGTRLLRVLAACTGLVLLALTASPTAHASAGFGELAKFKGKGTNGTGAPFVFSGEEAHAFGVDQSSGQVFVGTEAAVEDEHLKVQAYSSAGAFEASALLKPAKPLPPRIQTTEDWEGIAVDSKDSKIFALDVYKRQAEGVVDFNQLAAGTLYALKSKPEAKEGETAMLGTSETLEGNSNVQGKALLDPSGLVFDPKTEDILILGVVDAGSEKLHPAVVEVSTSGTVVGRWVDPETVAPSSLPDSPVVSSAGTLFFEEANELFAVSAKGLEENTAPENVFTFAEPVGFTTGPFAGEMVSFGQEGTAFGDALSISSSGTSGELVALAEVQAASETGELGERRNGALVFSYSEAGGHVKVAETGWTGGQPGEGGSGTHVACEIGFQYASPMVAAGSSGEVWVLSPAWGEVLKFGAGGTGCPAAKEAPGGLEALLAGKKVTNPEITDTLTLQAKVVQGNVLSTTWSFGDGTEEVVSSQPGEQTQTALTHHKFAKAGKATVEATVQTDNLATPTIRVTTTVNVTEVVGGSPKITKQPLSAAAVEGETVHFEAAAGGEPKPTVQWEVSTDSGKSWTPIGGAKSTTLTLEKVTTAQNGDEYQAVFENGVGTPATSAPATLTVESAAVHKEKVEREEAERKKAAEEEEAAIRRGQEEANARKAAQEAAERAQEAANARAAAEAAARKAAEEAAHREAAPAVTVAGGTLAVPSSGAFTVKVSCPAGVSTCTGTITLRTLTAVSARVGASAAAKRVLTLASGSFSVAGGSSRSLTLHLSAQAKKLLARSHTLKARVTLTASNPSGASATTSATVTLKAKKGR